VVPGFIYSNAILLCNHGVLAPVETLNNIKKRKPQIKNKDKYTWSQMSDKLIMLAHHKQKQFLELRRDF